MRNETGGTTISVNNTAYHLGTYDYSGKAARFATLDEVIAATTKTTFATNSKKPPAFLI